jgi:hypothetical protein
MSLAFTGSLSHPALSTWNLHTKMASNVPLLSLVSGVFKAPFSNKSQGLLNKINEVKRIMVQYYVKSSFKIQ